MSNTNSTDTSIPETASSPSADPPASTSSTSTDPTSTPPATSSSSTQETTPSSTSTPPTPTTSSSTSTSTDPTPTTPSSTTSSTSTTPTSSTTSTTPTPTVSSVVITTTQVSSNENGSTVIVVTSTQVNTNTPQQTVQPTSTDASGQIITTNTAGASGHMNEPAKIAVAVVVPIVAVALLLVAGIFFWRKRKQRRDAAEERRKEVEDYSYNPNNDPTLPDVGAGATGAYEMNEDGSPSGYRGWGSTTLGGSTGRKASTTMSGGAAAGVAYSDATSPTRGNFSDTRSGDGLMNEGGHSPPEGEILGAMGPNTNDNRGTAQVHRGPSNASSSYSATGRSDGSGDQTGSYGAPAYLDQYGGNNPYADGAYGQQRPGELAGQPVIRDNPARRNTRIENPSHYPQQSAGISQNF
ncbi:hypothetical protein F5Y05DRAFT_414911 [Hypoxylon sp. FL0543]|nr:hypothetical protein F5Y05DRAFT_414911 [Hypoxylon sp. FL0543]